MAPTPIDQIGYTFIDGKIMIQVIIHLVGCNRYWKQIQNLSRCLSEADAVPGIRPEYICKIGFQLRITERHAIKWAAGRQAFIPVRGKDRSVLLMFLHHKLMPSRNLYRLS
jgi:hypothetical protein